MTSQKSFQNNFGFAYRTGIKDNLVVGVISTLFLSIFFAFIPIYSFMQMKEKPTFTFLLTSGMDSFRYIVIIAMLGIGIFMGIMAFKFITGKKTVNVYYSLGIKRTSLFVAKFLSGVTVLLVSVLIPLLISVFANIAYVGANKFLFQSAVFLFVGLFSVAFVAYSITSLVFSMVGTAFEGIVFSGIVVLLPQIVLTCLEGLIQKLVFGTPYGQNFSSYDNYSGDYSMSLAQKYSSINPLRYFANNLFTFSQGGKDGELMDINNMDNVLKWFNPSYLTILCWIAFSVVIFFAAVYVYKNRKAEIGGFIGKNKPLNFIATFVVGFFGVALFLSNLNYSNVINLLIGLGVLTVIYIVFMLLLLRDKRQFVKTLYQLPIQIGITLLIFVFFSTNYFGLANKIPQVEDISYAQISTVATNNIANMDDEGIYLGSSIYNATNGKHAFGKYETKSDIEFVTGINKMIIDQGNKTASVYSNNFNGIYPFSIQIKYVLKNGKEVYRDYYGVNEEVAKKLLEIDSTDYNKARLKDIFTGEYNSNLVLKKNMSTQEMIDYSYNSFKKALRDDSSTVLMSNKMFENETALELTTDQRAKLVDCLYKDLTAQTTENKYSPKNTLGILMFKNQEVQMSDDDVEYSTYSDGSVSYSKDSMNEDDSERMISDFGESWNADVSPVYVITEDMKNTVDFLKSIGYYDNFTLSTNNIKSVKLIKIGDMFESGYYNSYFNDRVIKRKQTVSNEYCATYVTLDSYSKNDYIDMAYKINDDGVKNDLLANGLVRSLAQPDDYILILVGDHYYSTLLVDSSVVPESVKTEAGKINFSSIYN